MKIPEEISIKLAENEAKAIAIIESGEKLLNNFSTESIDLTYTISAPTDVLTQEERAQSMVFVFRFDHLPEILEFTVAEHRGSYYINEIDAIRAALNEYRTIFYNQNDAIYYRKIGNLYRTKLVNRDPSKGLSITARNKEGTDVTSEYVSYLDSTQKAIKAIIKASDFDYIFNGVLQHSDKAHSRKMIEHYTNGSMNYILLKNLTLARSIKTLLFEYYKVVKAMHFPRMGGL
jgi:hypothetical protein